jgi:hypothetical protein
MKLNVFERSVDPTRIEIGDLLIFENNMVRLLINIEGKYRGLNLERGYCSIEFDTIKELLDYYPKLKKVIKSQDLELRRF